MSWFAACKMCQEPVAVPDEVDRNESVCCPRCRAEFLSSEVLDETGQESGSSQPSPDVLPVEALFKEASEPESSGPSSETSEEEEEEEEDDDDEADRDEEKDEPGPDIGAERAEEFPEIDLSGGAQTDSDAVEPVAESQEPAGEAAESDDATQPDEEIKPADEAPATVDDTPEPAETTPPAPDHAESLRVRCPACEAEFALSQMIVASSGARLGADTASVLAGATAHSGAGESGGEGPMLDVWARADSVPQIDLGEAGGAEVVSTEPGAFDFAREDSEAANGSDSVAAARRERRRNQKSGFRTIMGPVFGGIAGLIIAYYLLNWIRGADGNFLEIPLPGVPHTYEHSPEWFPGWMKPAADSEEAAAEELADVEEGETLTPTA